MTQFYKGADSIGISWNLILLSLDAMIPAYGLVKAPVLTEADRAGLREWILQGPPLNCFAFGDLGRDFAEYAAVLERLVPQGRGAALLHWGAFTSSMVDPSPGQARKDWPGYACDEWLTALDEAHKIGTIEYLSIGPQEREILMETIMARQTRQAAVEEFTQKVKKEWDPYPVDPAQLAYNVRVKSPWDRKIYEEFCRENSTSLDFSVLFMVDHQEAHSFVRMYATQLSGAAHEIVRQELPRLLDGKGRYAAHPSNLHRLREFTGRPLESLLPFSQTPT